MLTTLNFARRLATLVHHLGVKIKFVPQVLLFVSRTTIRSRYCVRNGIFLPRQLLFEQLPSESQFVQEDPQTKWLLRIGRETSRIIKNGTVP